MHAREASWAISGSRRSQRWVAGAHFDHVFRPTAEAGLRSPNAQRVIRRARLMLSIACCFVRNGGNFSCRDSRVKDFSWEAGEDSYALLAFCSTRIPLLCLLFALLEILCFLGWKRPPRRPMLCASQCVLFHSKRRQLFPMAFAS